jgi:hypothetical protein
VSSHCLCGLFKIIIIVSTSWISVSRCKTKHITLKLLYYMLCRSLVKSNYLSTSCSLAPYTELFSSSVILMITFYINHVKCHIISRNVFREVRSHFLREIKHSKGKKQYRLHTSKLKYVSNTANLVFCHQSRENSDCHSIGFCLWQELYWHYCHVFKHQINSI